MRKERRFFPPFDRIVSMHPDTFITSIVIPNRTDLFGNIYNNVIVTSFNHSPSAEFECLNVVEFKHALDMGCIASSKIRRASSFPLDSDTYCVIERLVGKKKSVIRDGMIHYEEPYRVIIKSVNYSNGSSMQTDRIVFDHVLEGYWDKVFPIISRYGYLKSDWTWFHSESYFPLLLDDMINIPETLHSFSEKSISGILSDSRITLVASIYSSYPFGYNGSVHVRGRKSFVNNETMYFYYMDFGNKSDFIMFSEKPSSNGVEDGTENGMEDLINQMKMHAPNPKSWKVITE